MSFILPINFCFLVWTKKPECDLVIVRLNDKMKLHTVIYCKWTWCCRTCHIIIKLISFCIRWRHSVNAGACRGFGGYIHRRCRQEKGCKYIGVSINMFINRFYTLEERYVNYVKNICKSTLYKELFIQDQT